MALTTDKAGSHFPIPSVEKSSFLALALAVSPFFQFIFGVENGHHDNQRILEGLCLTLGACAVIHLLISAKIGAATIGKRVKIVLIFFFFLGLISSVTSYSPRHALHEWSSFLLLFGLAYLVADEIAISNASFLNKALTICGVGCLFYLFNVALIYVAHLSNDIQINNADLVFGFDNYRFFNHAQTVSLLMLCLLTARSRQHGNQYWIWFATTAMWWAMLYLTAGRGTILGIVSGLVVSWAFRRKLSLSWIRLLLSTAFAGAVTYIVFSTVLPLVLGHQPFGFLSSVVERTVENPTSSRIGIWNAALDMIVQFPLLGAGPLHFAHYGAFVDNAAHPHNWVLQIASEWGIPALILLSAVIGVGFRSLLRAAPHVADNDDIGQLTLAAWLTIAAAIVTDGLVSGLIVMPVSQMWIALYIGCAWGWISGLRMPAKKPLASVLPKKWVYMGVALVLAVVGLYWAGLFPELLDIQAFEDQAMASSLYPSGAFRPRIWRAGFF